MINLHLADHFPLALALNPCSGTRSGSPCATACLGHYSASNAGDENQVLLSVPFLPTVHEVLSGEWTHDPCLHPVAFALFQTGSVFLNDKFESANAFALVVQDHEEGE